jgi:catechol 2,3-dioxygenase-like lactoylglutathione lyase family enzyme
MRIYVTSVFVDDQKKALDFYTDVLGFQKKRNIPLARDSPDGPRTAKVALGPAKVES